MRGTATTGTAVGSCRLSWARGQIRVQGPCPWPQGSGGFVEKRVEKVRGGESGKAGRQVKHLSQARQVNVWCVPPWQGVSDVSVFTMAQV